MFKLIVQRLLALVPLLFIVSVLTFSFTSLLPSDPVDLIIGDLGTQEQYDMVRERLGLNEPVVLRYVEWLGRAVQGDLGTSFFNSVSVTGAVMQRLPVTLSLTVVSALIAVVVGVGAGIAAALRPRSWIDRLATLGATIGQAIPNFWFGLIMVAVFAVNLRWFPATGFTPISASPWDWLRSVTLPALALGLSSSAAIARQVRSAMVGVLQQDYIRAARAQGLSARRVVFKHALTNAMVPVVAVLSFQITVLLGGALIVEQVFAINGLGTLAITAVRRQDIPMIQGLVLVMVALVVIVQLATDVVYGLLNPKARPS
jgi:peptide/nickel transport system permease protein